MSYLIAIHLLVGFLTGSVFRVRALVGLVAVVLVECLATAATLGVREGLWSLTNLAAIQMGYLGGVYARCVLEKAGLADPDTQAKRSR